MKVSVIIPVYNAERCVSESVKNCKKQTFEDFEVIFVDDCSTDETVKIIEEEIKGDGRFRLIKLNENRRQGYARNIGLENAIGEYVMFFDVDDEYSPEFIEKMYNKITRDKADMTACKFWLIDGETCERMDIVEPMFSDLPQNMYDGFCAADTDLSEKLLDGACTVWDKIYRREFLVENDIKFPNDLYNKEDTVFAVRCTFRAKKISVLDEYLYFYKIDRQKYENKFFSKEEVFDTLNMFEYIRNDLQKLDIWEKHRVGFLRYEIYTLRYFYKMLEQKYHEEFFYHLKKSYERYKNLPQKIREEDSVMAALLDKVLETEEYTEETDEYIKNF